MPPNDIADNGHDREWIVYVNEAYYPSAEIIRAPTPQRALEIASDERLVGDPASPDAPLMAVAPFDPELTNIPLAASEAARRSLEQELRWLREKDA